MKSFHFLLIILLLAGCTEEGEPVPQLTANFASTFIGIESSEQGRSVSIELNRVPLFPTTVEVKLTNASGTAYGVDYITKLKLAEDNEQRSFELTIISVSNNGLPGSNDSLTVDLE